VLIGAFTMWAAQLDSAAWAYGIAGGAVFFLLGITGGLIEPPNSKHMEDWFMTSSISAPLSSCLATWLYRNALTPPATLEAAALTGALAAFPFLTITMALHLLAWRQERAIKLLAELYLHNDDFNGEAIALLNSAEESEGTEAWLYDRRGLAHALAGDENAAEADWARHAELEPEGTAPDISRGWLALRRDRLEDAASAFERACARRKRDRWAAVGLGITRLRQGNAQAAVEVLKTVKDEAHDALSLTYLAEAYLAAGAAEMAASMATTAIEELDSVHGRSWLVRARALRRLGKIDEAAKDYNKACWAADEDWVSDAAMAELVEIDRPLTEDEPED
jgi:tetratricopeptide (TPR) repeat protein